MFESFLNRMDNSHKANPEIMKYIYLLLQSEEIEGVELRTKNGDFYKVEKKDDNHVNITFQPTVSIKSIKFSIN